MNDSKGISFFQIGIFATCAIGVVLALLIFTGKIPLGDAKKNPALAGTVTVWGTLPGDAVRAMTEEIRQEYRDVSFVYSEKKPAQFQSEFVNALASGKAPDLVIINPEMLIQNRDRLMEIPYASLSQATFKGSFVDQGSLFLTDTGTKALPLLVDPLVMYYNRDMLAGSFTVTPPATWDDLVALNKKILVKDDAGVLTTQTVAMGTYENVTHAKEILLALAFQTGSSLVSWDPETKKYVSRLGEADASGNLGMAKALGFYTAFSHVTDEARYSWNASLPKDKDQFLAGRLALYFGFASEQQGIRQKNPNLNFDIALFPQRTQSPVKATYGRMFGVAIPKMTKQSELAIAMAQQLVSKKVFDQYRSFNPSAIPARKEALAQPPEDAHLSLFYKSAIISQDFLDPDQGQTGDLLKRMIGQINAGLLDPDTAVSQGDSLMTSILQRAQPESSQ